MFASVITVSCHRCGFAHVLIAASLLGMSCVGCCARSASTESDIQEHIDNLRRTVPPVYESGRFIPLPTPDTESLVSYGEEAVPFLVKAITPEEPLRAGYAAWCLERLDSPVGSDQARRCLHQLEQEPCIRDDTADALHIEFAIGALRSYLVSTLPVQQGNGKKRWNTD